MDNSEGTDHEVGGGLGGGGQSRERGDNYNSMNNKIYFKKSNQATKN